MSKLNGGDVSLISDEFKSVYMGLAKHVSTMKNSCYSRKIGTVIVDPVVNKVLSIGWNGPPRKFPSPDSYEYLREYFWPQLTEEEKGLAWDAQKFVDKCVRPTNDHGAQEGHATWFSEKMDGCKTCPRRLVNAGSGERSELCPCVHSEINAIINAGCPLNGSVLFCYADIGPCQACAVAIMQAQISECYFLKGKEKYHSNAIKMMERVGIKYFEVDLV